MSQVGTGIEVTVVNEGETMIVGVETAIGITTEIVDMIENVTETMIDRDVGGPAQDHVRDPGTMIATGAMIGTRYLMWIIWIMI